MSYRPGDVCGRVKHSEVCLAGRCRETTERASRWYFVICFYEGPLINQTNDDKLYTVKIFRITKSLGLHFLFVSVLGQKEIPFNHFCSLHQLYMQRHLHICLFLYALILDF